MGFDLLSTKSNASYLCNNGHWHYLLEIALAHGWKPNGTVIRKGVFPYDKWPVPNDWCGAYTSNDWQIVTEDDARALGTALFRAARNLRQRRRPRHLRLVGSREPDLEASLFGEHDDQPIEPIERFAAFALKGEFQIG